MRPINRTLLSLGMASVLAVGLMACDDDDDNPIAPNPNPNPNPDPGPASRVVDLDGDITGNRALSPDSIYFIQGFLEVRPGGTLTVPAGTQLVSDINTNGTIVTLRGDGSGPSGRLVVQGTAGNPVIFQPGTRNDAEGLAPAQVASCARGQAGGIVLHGNAPTNVPGGTAISEGVSRPFGGGDPADSSGDIQFLVIACGGTQIAPDNEVNGLTFAGTGSGTRISFVQTHLIADDGFEWFGGTTNADHLISSGNDDDAFDCDFGWNGTVQFGLAVQDRDLANRGIECDNDGDASPNTPITAPTFWNITWVGAGVERANSDVNDGPFLRRNSAPSIFNSIITNFGNVGVAIDGSASRDQALAGNLRLDGLLFFNNQGLALAGGLATAQGDCLTDNVFFRLNSEYTNEGVAETFGGGTFVCDDPQFNAVNFADPINGSIVDARPATGSPALDANNALQPTGPGVVDASARFLGAFDASNDWTTGWATWVAPSGQ